MVYTRMKKQIKTYIIATLIATAPAMISTSCGSNAANEADRAREELKNEEEAIQAERQNREREDAVRLNEIRNEKRLQKAKSKIK